MYEDIEIYHYKGTKSGPHLLVIAGIHGIEKGAQEGAMQLKEALDNGLELETGEVTIVPYGNPPACRETVRWFGDRNLNRMIRSYPEPKTPEEHFSNQIVGLITRSNVVLDLHCFQAKTPEGEPAPFLTLDYRTPETEALSAALGMRRVTGWVEMNANTSTLSIEDTTNYAHSLGKIGITVECGQNSDPKAAGVGYRSARRMMGKLGICAYDDPGPLYDNGFLRIDDVVLNDGPNKKDTELLVQPVNFGKLVKDQPMAQCSDGSIKKAPYDCRMVMPSRYADPGCDLTYLAVEEPAPRIVPALSVLLTGNQAKVPVLGIL